MKQNRLNRLTQAIGQMNWRQRKLLQNKLDALQERDASIRAIELHTPSSCPSCGSTHIVSNGLAAGLQRYLCRSCQRTFKALSGIPLAHLHKRHKRHKWLAHTQALGAGLSIPQVARQLGIACGTAFRWRHRFLHLPSQLQAGALAGIAEADESYFLQSRKGERSLLRKARHRGGKASKPGVSRPHVAVLMVRDRSGATANLIVPCTTAAQLSQALGPMPPTDTILCTDGSRALAAAAGMLGVQHRSVNVSAGVRVDGSWHIQNVNAYASRLRGWMHRVKGVATKYLASYLGWFRMLDRAPRSGPQPASVLHLAIAG